MHIGINIAGWQVPRLFGVNLILVYVFRYTWLFQWSFLLTCLLAPACQLNLWFPFLSCLVPPWFHSPSWHLPSPIVPWSCRECKVLNVCAGVSAERLTPDKYPTQHHERIVNYFTQRPAVFLAGCRKKIVYKSWLMCYSSASWICCKLNIVRSYEDSLLDCLKELR